MFLTLAGRWGAFRFAGWLWLSGGALLVVIQLAYIFAFRYAPAAQVDLINYLWPSMLILLAGQFRSRYTGLLVVLAGAGGIYVALDPTHLQMGYLGGYLAALTSASGWTGYVLLVRRYDPPPEWMCLSLGLGTPVYWILHCYSGDVTTSLVLHDWMLCALYGGGVYVVAYLSWGYAMRYGSPAEAGALSYLIPLLSIFALIGGGYAEFTPRLIWATALIVVAATIPLFEARLRWFKAPLAS